jgi:hypothetical protein
MIRSKKNTQEVQDCNLSTLYPTNKIHVVYVEAFEIETTVLEQLSSSKVKGCEKHKQRICTIFDHGV